EGTGERQAFLRQVQGGTQEGRLTRDVRKPQAQAEAGL
ncbi:MAG: LSU ribosomal protein L36p @ LSU ribosomal protein L36p, zinc-dependent, partial [uncultured Rubrobacteraceae bacterium]